MLELFFMGGYGYFVWSAIGFSAFSLSAYLAYVIYQSRKTILIIKHRMKS